MKRIRFAVFLSCVAIAAFILTTHVVIYGETQRYLYHRVAEVPKAQAIMIPGAAILLNGGLSPVFRDRVDRAIELYRAAKAPKILVSGDNSTVEHNEVNPVRNYLLQRGVPDQDIFLDHAGFDTYSTMYRARAIFGADSIIVATQSFHLPRAVFLARSLGMAAYGMSADQDGHSLLFRNYVREAFAKEKAILDLAIGRTPRYLGEPIPITGDGRNYP